MGVVGAIVAWVFADLYLRIELPFAADLIHLAFRTAAVAVGWLQEGDGHRPRTVAIVAAAVFGGGLVATAAGQGVWFWRFAALPAGALMGAGFVIACLMERGMAAGLFATVGVLAAMKVEGSEPGRIGRVAAPVGTVALAAGGAYYLSELLAARSEGYGALDWFALADGPLGNWGLPLLLLAFAAGTPIELHFSDPDRAKPAALALGAGTVGAVVFGAAAPTLPYVAASAAAVAVVVRGWSSLIRGPAELRWEPSRFAFRVLPFALAGWLLVGHTYLERVFACPDVVDPAFVETAPQDGEVTYGLAWPDDAPVVRVRPLSGAEPAFRVVLNDDGTRIALSQRSDRNVGFVRLVDGAVHDGWGTARPTALPAYEEDRRDHENQSLASIEELLWAPANERYYGTALGGHPDFYGMPNSPRNVVNNVVLELPADASEVTRAVGLEHLCWIGALAWREADHRLYLGCEYEPSLHRYDPVGGRVEATLTDEAIGDVAALVSSEDGSSLYSVSFWSSQAVAEIDPETMTIVQRRDVGGAHYDVALDGLAGRLFLSSYYGSRVRMLRTSDLATVGLIPTGLGTRALATDPSRDLVLASSAYDGKLTMARSSTGEVLKRVRVGGHVKDIAIDRERGRAFVSSQCGLISVELPD